MSCNCKCTAKLVLAAGVLLLGADLGWWGLWGIQWWTLAFLILGVKGMWSSKGSCSIEEKKKKKRK